MTRSQLMVSRRLSWWDLEKLYARKNMRHLWEARSRPWCQGLQRKCAGYLSTASWKLKVSGSRNNRVIREMTKKEKKWTEVSKRSEATHNEMTHARAMWDECELESMQCAITWTRKNSQGTLTLTTRETTKTNKLSCGSIHTVHESLVASGHSTCCRACRSRSVCRIHLLSMHQTYSLSDLYGNSL